MYHCMTPSSQCESFCGITAGRLTPLRPVTQQSEPVLHLQQALMDHMQRPPEVLVSGNMTVEIAFMYLAVHPFGFEISPYTLQRIFPTKRRDDPGAPPALREADNTCCSLRSALFQLGRDKPAAWAPLHSHASLRLGLSLGDTKSSIKSGRVLLFYPFFFLPFFLLMHLVDLQGLEGRVNWQQSELMVPDMKTTLSERQLGRQVGRKLSFGKRLSWKRKIFSDYWLLLLYWEVLRRGLNSLLPTPGAKRLLLKEMSGFSIHAAFEEDIGSIPVNFSL